MENIYAINHSPIVYRENIVAMQYSPFLKGEYFDVQIFSF